MVDESRRPGFVETVLRYVVWAVLSLVAILGGAFLIQVLATAQGNGYL
jgi:hypothetical protein